MVKRKTKKRKMKKREMMIRKMMKRINYEKEDDKQQ